MVPPDSASPVLLVPFSWKLFSPNGAKVDTLFSLREHYFNDCSDWFMNTYNAGKSFQSILPEILAQQAAMASDDDEDEDEDDE